jgi:uncharacterized protein (DUF1697 family)
MKYIVLLRKINAGKVNRIDKKSLKETFISLRYSNVEIYINSGNVIFTSNKGRAAINKEINEALYTLFKSQIQFVIKTIKEMKVIGKAIPDNWQNNDKQRTDVFFLFSEVDRPEIIGELPIKKEYINLKYVKGALIINVKRKNVFKSQYGKIIGSKLYKFITIRNVNTSRYLASIDE